jgi:hypothetical protein
MQRYFLLIAKSSTPVTTRKSNNAQTVEIAPISWGQFENLWGYSRKIIVLEIVNMRSDVREFKLQEIIKPISLKR